ncbi:hypothetical protein U3516DRAFT_741871 [Neocallimastix sp. 'constans']
MLIAAVGKWVCEDNTNYVIMPLNFMDEIISDEQQNISKPIIYVIGGVNVIIHYNAFNDFNSVRHMRTYDCTHDGTVADNDLYLVRFHFKNGSNVIPSNWKGWTIEQKKFLK